LDTVSRQIFGDIQEIQFPGSKMEVNVHLKNVFQAELETEGSRLATIFGLPPIPRRALGRGWELRKKGKKQKLFLVLSPRPGLDGPNASGWYRRLREPISPFSMFNSVQL